MAKKSKTKKKQSFVLSDEELDQVSGGAGPAGARVQKIEKIAVQKGIGGGGAGAQPYGDPRPVNRATGSGFGGGEQM